jgi:hypothetical protein
MKVLEATNILTILLESQSLSTLTFQKPLSKELALREIPSIILLACKRRRTSNFTSTKHSPVTYFKALVPIQLP